jgi:hypothetical protein
VKLSNFWELNRTPGLSKSIIMVMDGNTGIYFGIEEAF